MDNQKGLKSLRDAFGYSQKEVAENLGIPLPTYKSWEQGRVSRLQRKNSRALSELYGISEEEFREIMAAADDDETLNQTLSKVLVGDDVHEPESPGMDILFQIVEQLPEKDLGRVIDFALKVMYEYYDRSLKESGVLHESMDPDRYNPYGIEQGSPRSEEQI